MNSWNFNELTQQDVLDYKACQRKDGSVYGVPNKSDCVKGKEIKVEDLQKLAVKANAGDAKAKAKLAEIQKVQAEQKVKDKETKAKEKEAAAKKKQKELEAACKSGAKKGKECKGIKKEKGGKGGKGKKGSGKKGGGKKGGEKKGGGKGKSGGKGRGGGGQSKGAYSKEVSAEVKKRQREAAAARQQRQKDMRKRLSELQSQLRQIKNPEVKKALEASINDLLKGVAELSKTAPD